ncbi:quinoprotein dehydrogenase-associated SoxYZ-like carrier [Variovorax sp.]|uniref:quinoprotein dehydrogenase-associated SoxYZ-like carrier n=1 Tax=Variovorax sp. TaxID=1871043 RepID=UPI002D409B94|nr:quinoprotein dehydrogenase-associated SoxYZ-like carrier [Variovorax sp.]HYP85411.1 quinoprotein dehydrogenase-associated SoxYZ-like carrier [Variovorax sp.]
MTGPAEQRRRAWLRAAGAGALLAAWRPAGAQLKTADNPEANPVWQKLRASLFQSRPIAPAADWFSLVLPARAEDAAIVPVAIQTRPPASSPATTIEKLWLIIDNNPSPLAGVFEFTPESGRADLETRVRIDEYTHVRAIAQTGDGQFQMALGFVKASGGCSAPPSKDLKAAQATLGRMRLQVQPPAAPGAPQLVQLMISHPNSSGLALDPVSRLYSPPHFVRELKVTLDGRTVLAADLDFAISENPNFRFYVLPRSDGELRAEIVDNQDLKFHTQVMLRRASP